MEEFVRGLLPAAYLQDSPKQNIRIVFWVAAAVLVLVFVGYTSGFLKQLPCGQSWWQALQRNFIHVELPHLLANLYAFYVLSRLEDRLGNPKYATGVLAVLLVSTTAEWAYGGVTKGAGNCSIGFSGVLFGIAAWELVTARAKLDLALLLGLAAMVITPSIGNRRVSFRGHLIGALSGVAVGLGHNLIAGGPALQLQ